MLVNGSFGPEGFITNSTFEPERDGLEDETEVLENIGHMSYR
jgi:hypothetical protein